MSSHCQHCHKGISFGHAVSHAKNRIARIFRPNIQKLKVLRNGILVRVSLCTSCIKRLKKDGRIGIYALQKAQVTPVSLKLPSQKQIKIAKKVEKIEDKTQTASETLKIESIVGKKDSNP